MKNMKRIAALGLSAVLAATALAGCGSSSSTSTSTDSSASTGDTAAADTSASTGDKVKLTLGSWTSQPEVLQDLIDAYEAENPNVEIDIQITPYKGGEYWTKLEASAGGGTAPDVFWLNVLHIDSYADGGILADMTDAVAASDIKDNFPESLVNSFVRDGKNYATPKDFDTNALWYNKDLFDQAGVAYPTDDMSYEDLVALATELKDKLPDGIYPFACPVDFQTWYYQTVYAKYEGSAAAPTAGLHFTRELLQQIADKGIKIAYVTLHVGLGTFRPVKEENVLEHHMHSEYYQVTEEAANTINETKRMGGRVICVGTTSCRTVESAADEQGMVQPGCDNTEIFIYPGYRFKVLDALITNFHLPESTLVMLVSALAGREHILHAYEEAIREKYRFFSFGDAMFIAGLKGEK